MRFRRRQPEVLDLGIDQDVELPFGEAPVTLTEFLLARIAEDEAMAQASDGAGAAPGSGGLFWDDEYGGEVCIDPGRLRAECQAKRRIVEECVAHVGQGPSAAGLADIVLCHLASAYADHPDYREEWKP